MEEKNLAQENVIKEQIHAAESPPEKSLLAKKSVIAAIATVIVLSLVGLTLFLLSRDSQKTSDQAVVVADKPPGQILFEPADVVLLPASESSTDITINTGGNMVGGVVLALKYNPQVLRNVKLEQVKDPTSAISYALEPVGEIEHDTQNGALLMTLALPEGSQGLSGRGVVARLTFTKGNFNVAIPSSFVEMTPITNFITVQDGRIPVTRNQLEISFSK